MLPTTRQTSNATILDSRIFNERAFFPRRDVSETPRGAEDHSVEVSGASLHLRIHRAKDASAAVLIFHGNGEVVCDYDAPARMFNAIGADLAVIDFRGYGASSGTPTLRDAIQDALPVFEKFKALCGDNKLFVMGRSLGSACAVHLYSTLPQDAVAGFIIESGFSNISALIQRRGLTPLAASAADSFFDPIAKYKKGSAPLLIVHGGADSIISPVEAEAALGAAASTNKQLVTLPERGHNDISYDEEYWPTLDRFITGNL